MSMTLVADAGMAKLHRWTLRPGQQARIGRSPWVEFSVPEADALEHEHFLLVYETVPVVRASQRGIRVEPDGPDIAELNLFPDDRDETRFFAGGVRFTARKHDSPVALLRSEPIARLDEKRAASSFQEWLDKLTEMKLSESALAIALEYPQSLAFIKKLDEQKQFQDAWLALSRLLPARSAIRWAFNLLDSHDPGLSIHREALDRWCEDGSESKRTELIALCSNAFQYAPSRYWVEAIRLSGGSLSPAGQPPVKPPPHLYAIAVATALRLHFAGAADTDPKSAIESGLAFLSAEIENANKGAA